MASHPIYSVSYRNLLWIYAIIPLCLLIFLLDRFLLNFSLRASLNTFPQDYVILNTVFGLPHILASSAILLSCHEYYQHYKIRLWLACGVIIISLSLAALTLSYAVLFFIIVSISAAHLLKQQFGLGNMLCRMSGPMYKIWCWSSIAVAIILYSAMFQRTLYSVQQIRLLDLCALFLLSVHIASTVYWWKQVRRVNINGQLFLWGNCALICITAGLYWADYYFLAVLAPRFIHDTTAFYIYITHDKNRLSRLSRHHRLHAWLVRSVWLWPLAFIGLAYLLLYQLDNALQWAATSVFNLDAPVKIALALVTFLNLFHYYTETFTWGKTSPYRNYLAFRPN